METKKYKKIKSCILLVIYILLTLSNKTVKSSEITTDVITEEKITKSKENNNNTLNLDNKIKEELPTEDKLMKERYLSQQRSFQYPSPFTTSSYEQYIDSNNNNNWSLNKENNNQVTAKLMTDQSQAEFPRFPGSSSNTNGINEYEAYGSEEYYSHQPPHDHLYLPPPIVMKQPMMVPQKSMISNLFSTDFIKILLLLILKLLLIKLKTIGFIKIVLLILLKLPVIFFGIIFKLLLFVKITNLFKLLTLPLFLPLILIILAPILLLLLPLLLIPFAPLLLIPLLLPLLLFLPIPVLTVTTTTTTTTTTAAPSGKRRRRRFISNEYNNNNNNLPYEYSDSRNNELLFFRNLIESEKCLERIACKLAADRRSTLFNSYILRILDFAKEYLINPRLYSYAHAYRSGVSSDSTFATCTNKYPCSRLKS